MASALPSAFFIILSPVSDSVSPQSSVLSFFLVHGPAPRSTRLDPRNEPTAPAPAPALALAPATAPAPATATIACADGLSEPR